MKRLFTSVAMAVLLTGAAFAVNTTTTVSQVSEAVTISTDVDYIITGDTPFAEGGSVNIENTDHAVLILRDIKPSLVLSKKLLSKIFIKGAKAVDGSNCQVRMYAHGTIILPYDKNLRPLTAYTEKNCEGDSYDKYNLNNSGGYMQTLNKATLNNRIRSFVLKRGYMVTFAVGTSGWGYSRCFIADTEDLVFNELPAILDQRISSYRIFKWHYAQKKGIASTGAKDINDALNTSWCYDWAQGNADRLPDQEWVPNHIYEDWPSTSTIGSVTQSCHSKNNNEPANNSDDHPQSVQTVLDNWQNMMRTGLRLCSPATHDGGWGWHDEFMTEIDKRGWRCDIVDFHGYWDGEWGSLDWRIDRYAYGRPVWFSEWVWGASWNNNGIFSQAPDGKNSFSQRNQQKCYDGTKPILDRLEANARVERYAYWNGEADASKVFRGGELSILGKYYAGLKSAMAYRKANEFVPKLPPIAAVANLTSTYDAKTQTATISWSDSNGDLLNSITLQRKAPGSSKWEDIQSITPQDQNSKDGVTYKATDALKDAEPGEYEYRVATVSYAGKTNTSGTTAISIASQQKAADFVFGTAQLPQAIDLASNTTILNTAAYITLNDYEAAPYAFIGLPSNKNSNIGVTSFLYQVTKQRVLFGAMPWLSGFNSSYTSSEEMDYVIIGEGTYKYGDMQVVVGKAASISNTVEDVVFDTPFPEGDSVVVICQANMGSTKYGTVTRVTDVTNTGFKLRHVGQSTQSTITKKAIYYIAASKGQAKLGDGYVISAGTSDQKIGGTTYRNTAFDSYSCNADNTLRHDTLRLADPVVLCGPQTDCLSEVASTFRVNAARTANATAADGSQYKATYGLSIKRQIDASAGSVKNNTAALTGDTMGWICISRDIDGTNPDGIIAAPAIDDDAYYTTSGMRLDHKPSAKGIYIHKQRKMIVR